MKYLKYIPGKVSYEILDDGTIEICGARLHAKADGILWEYCDEKLDPKPTEIDPFIRTERDYAVQNVSID